MNKKRVAAFVIIVALAGGVFWGMRHHSRPSSKAKLVINDSFEYPFLGSIKCHSQTEEIVLATKDGKTSPVAVKTFYTEDGHFLRAEFTKPDSKAREFPIKEQESFIAQGLQKIEGLPSHPPKLDAKAVLECVNKVASVGRNPNFGGATKMHVTRAIFKNAYRSPETVYIANLWEIDDEFFRGIGKGRYVLDEDGKLLFFDNVL